MSIRVFSSKISRNLGRIISDKLVNYENVVMEVCYNSETMAYIRFVEVSDPEYRRLICRINIYEDYYNFVGFIPRLSTTIPVKNFISDRWKIHRWVDKTIKEYRREGK